MHQADTLLCVERADELGAQERLVATKQSAWSNMPPRLKRPNCGHELASLDHGLPLPLVELLRGIVNDLV